jgi:hypothetical protein
MACASNTIVNSAHARIGLRMDFLFSSSDWGLFQAGLGMAGAVTKSPPPCDADLLLPPQRPLEMDFCVLERFCIKTRKSPTSLNSPAQTWRGAAPNYQPFLLPFHGIGLDSWTEKLRNAVQTMQKSGWRSVMKTTSFPNESSSMAMK